MGEGGARAWGVCWGGEGWDGWLEDLRDYVGGK